VAAGSADGYRDGETALIVKVPAAEPIVGGWRSQLDAAAAAEVLAHMTVRYPFLDMTVSTPAFSRIWTRWWLGIRPSISVWLPRGSSQSS